MEAYHKPLGTFLSERKQAGDVFYRRFLNAYGDDWYCAFSIQDKAIQMQKGLYCYVLDDQVMYIGRCRDSFEKRINQGYGVIHPKNCYLDGQATNCHLNALINQYTDDVQCWYYPLLDNISIEQIESKLISWYKPVWNIV